jgi:hypothetical protein
MCWRRAGPKKADLEPLVLKNSFDCCIFSRRGKLGLEDYPKGTIADNLTLGVLHVSRLASLSILDFLAHNLCQEMSSFVSDAQSSAKLTSHAQAVEHPRPILRHDGPRQPACYPLWRTFLSGGDDKSRSMMKRKSRRSSCRHSESRSFRQRSVEA